MSKRLARILIVVLLQVVLWSLFALVVWWDAQQLLSNRANADVFERSHSEGIALLLIVWIPLAGATLALSIAYGDRIFERIRNRRQ